MIKYSKYFTLHDFNEIITKFVFANILTFNKPLTTQTHFNPLTLQLPLKLILIHLIHQSALRTLTQYTKILNNPILLSFIYY